VDFLYLILGLIILVAGAEVVIRGSVSFGKKLNISLFAIGVVIVAGGTSLPELASSINAVITQHADLALGAVVGSNIANLILVMAATTIIFPITNINNNQINQAWINIALGIALIFMSYFYFNFVFGILSLTLLTFIMYIQIKRGSVNIDEINKGDYSTIISISLIIIGIVFLIYGSELFVSSAINLANTFSVSETVIGLSLIAFGTSLPELVVGVMSALKRKVDFALGNILGSNIYNVLGVLGVISFFDHFSMPDVLAKQDLIFMLLITFMILGFMYLSKKLGRTYGVIGLVLYFSYMYFIYI
jgi:cation:H+ antiporter